MQILLSYDNPKGVTEKTIKQTKSSKMSWQITVMYACTFSTLTKKGKIMNAKKSYRPNEQEYHTELDSIQREIKWQRPPLWKHPYQWLFSPVVKDLKHRAKLIKRALRSSTLPPLPDELRNPLNIPPTPSEIEFLRVSKMYFDGLERQTAE